MAKAGARHRHLCHGVSTTLVPVDGDSQTLLASADDMRLKRERVSRLICSAPAALRFLLGEMVLETGARAGFSFTTQVGGSLRTGLLDHRDRSLRFHAAPR